MAGQRKFFVGYVYLSPIWGEDMVHGDERDSTSSVEFLPRPTPVAIREDVPMAGGTANPEPEATSR
jgi:hypothetical protein